MGLVREAREGQARGARFVRVRIEGDSVVAGCFTMRAPIPGPARAARFSLGRQNPHHQERHVVVLRRACRERVGAVEDPPDQRVCT